MGKTIRTKGEKPGTNYANQFAVGRVPGRSTGPVRPNGNNVSDTVPAPFSGARKTFGPKSWDRG